MAIKISINNIIIFMTSLLPILIGSFFIINSFFNYDLKGIIWLIGLLIASVIKLLVKMGFSSGGFGIHPWIKENRAAKVSELPSHDFCEIFEPIGPDSSKKTKAVDSHAFFHGFTLFYLLSGNDMNPLNSGTGFIVIYGVLIAIDTLYRLIKGCAAPLFGVLLGLVLGGILGISWFYLVINVFADGREKVFFGIDPVAKKCAIGNSLSKKTFKCTQRAFNAEEATTD
jgi:hypothetical protein